MTDNIDNPYGSLQYDFLHFIQTKKKDDFRKGGEGEKWAASIVNFMLGECQPLVKRENVENARLVELGKVIAKDYKRIIDPIDPKTGEGGTADYFYADWEANPIYLHLQRIIDAKLSQSTMRATIKATDELSKSKRQKENDRIIHRNWIREIINMMLSQAGFPTIGSDEDPNEFIEKNEIGNR